MKLRPLIETTPLSSQRAWRAIDASLQTRAGYDLATAISIPVMAYGMTSPFLFGVWWPFGLMICGGGYVAMVCAESFSNETEVSICGTAEQSLSPSNRPERRQRLNTHLESIRHQTFWHGIGLGLCVIETSLTNGSLRQAFGLATLAICAHGAHKTHTKALQLKHALTAQPR